jgi:hypothetical protein
MPEKMTITTPIGELRWVTVTGAGRENLSGDMQYSADVVLPMAEAQELVDKLDAFWESNKPKAVKTAKSMGYKVLEDEAVSFTLKTKTAYPSGDPKKVKIFNSQVKQVEIPDGTRIANGSRGRLAGVAAIYQAGKGLASLRSTRRARPRASRSTSTACSS